MFKLKLHECEISDLKCHRKPNPQKRKKEIMCLCCLNFTELRSIFLHCSLRGMTCKSLQGSNRKNLITFRKRTIQFSEQNTYSKHFHCNLAHFEQVGQLAILLQYPPLHLQKLMLTQMHRCDFLYSPSLKQFCSFPREEHKAKS